MLVRLVKAACPSQLLDQYTPDAWHFMLDDIDYADAKAAVRHLGRLDLEPGKARYIEPGHVIAQVRRIRGKRIEEYGPIDPPSGLDSGAYLRWLRDTSDAIASGRMPERPALAANPERGTAIVSAIADALPDIDA